MFYVLFILSKGFLVELRVQKPLKHQGFWVQLIQRVLDETKAIIEQSSFTNDNRV